MTSLLDYDVITNKVFYKCWHILEYIDKHKKTMSELDKEAIQATIMDALVYKKLIDPTKQSLDLKNLSIVDNLDHYKYEKHPRISGIPLWMKEEFRKKALYVTGSCPISLFITRPPNRAQPYCIYDPNIAISSIFEDATFYECYYNSPTRGVRIESTRPFVEVNIDGEDYLVDTLTKRILKSDWFKENYDFEVVSEYTLSKLDKKESEKYQNLIREKNMSHTSIIFMQAVVGLNFPQDAEMKYELEQSKKYFPKEWERHELLQRDIATLPFDKVLLKEIERNK